jgi:putative membrane protein
MKMANSSLAAIALTLMLGACGPKTEKTVDTATNDASEAAANLGNATSNAFETVEQAIDPTPTGQEFADKAAKSDAFELAAAKLAADNASSVRIKSFAQDMIKAHTESTLKIKAAAKKAMPAITPDPTLTGDQNDKLADLGKLKGADFDKKYAATQIDAHESALSLMKDYAKDGDVARLKTAAGEIAPIVQKHLDMAKALEPN